MSAFRSQHKLAKGQSPVIINVLNFAKGADHDVVRLEVAVQVTTAMGVVNGVADGLQNLDAAREGVGFVIFGVALAEAIHDAAEVFALHHRHGEIGSTFRGFA